MLIQSKRELGQQIVTTTTGDPDRNRKRDVDRVSLSHIESYAYHQIFKRFINAQSNVIGAETNIMF